MSRNSDAMEQAFFVCSMTLCAMVASDAYARDKVRTLANETAAKKQAEQRTENAGQTEEDTKTAALYKKEWNNYRVGDIYIMGFLHSTQTPLFSPNWTPLSKEMLARFPDSIASRYLQCIRPYDTSNPRCAAEALRQKCTEPASVDEIARRVIAVKGAATDASRFFAGKQPREIPAVHVRVGDVVNMSKYTSEGFLTGQPSSLYTQVCRKLKSEGEDRAILVGGIHKVKTPSGRDVKIEDSYDYIEDVVARCAEEGVETITVSGTPDEDLCTFYHAKKFVAQPRSNFSTFVLGARQTEGKERMTVTLEDFPRCDDGVESMKRNDLLSFVALGILLLSLFFFVIAWLRPRPRAFRQKSLFRALPALLFFTACVFLMLFPLLKKRPERTSYDTFQLYASRLCRRLYDADIVFLIPAITGFLVFGAWWVCSIRSDCFLPLALLALNAAGVIGLRISWYQNHLKFVWVNFLALLLFVGEMTNDTPKKRVLVSLVIIAPLAFLRLVEIVTGSVPWKHDENTHIEPWAWYLSYAMNALSIVFFCLWIFWATRKARITKVRV